MKPRDLLVEIGMEEVPARFLPGVVEQFSSRLEAAIDAAGLEHGPVRGLGAPRRVAALVRDLAPVQPDRTVEVRGPSEKAGTGPDGRPTKAAEGFARSQGVAVDALVRRENAAGAVYLFAVKTEPGRPTRELLPDLVAGVVAALQFPKKMRWGKLDFSFVRPVRWLLCLYGRDPVPLRIPGLPGDLDRPPGHSRGHRFLAPGPVKIKEAGMYVESLRSAAVLVDPDERRRLIAAGACKLAGEETGGTADLIPDLLEETTWLAEHPTPVYGNFAPSFLDLPEVVLTTVMRRHQRYFPVRETGRDPSGATQGRPGDGTPAAPEHIEAARPGKRGRPRPGCLLPGFIAVRDGSDEHLELVRRGYERVLVARLADARFFFTEDRRRSLASRLPELRGVVYHERLGSLAEKTARLEHIVGRVAEAIGLDEQQAVHAATAARLAKCDLVVQMVREFPELQGVIGGEYARLEGLPEEVAAALETQYRVGGAGAGKTVEEGAAASAVAAGIPRAAAAPAARTAAGILLRPNGARPPAAGPPLSPVAAVLALADRADALVGYHYAGERSTGSEDPYGMRRAAQEVVTVALSVERGLDLKALAGSAADAYRKVNGVSLEDLSPAVEETCSLLRGRVEAMLAEQGCRYDEVAAVMASAGLPFDPVVLRAAGLALREARSRPWFGDLVTAGVRAAGLGAGPAARDPEVPRAPAPELFEERAESELHRAYLAAEAATAEHLMAGEFIDYWERLSALKEPLDRFLDNVLVMAEDPGLRANRLALCAALHRLYAYAADLSRIVLASTE